MKRRALLKFFAGSTLLCVAVAGSAAYVARTAANGNGSYKLRIAGELEGDGNASVGSSRMTLNCQLQDGAGNEGHLVLSNVVLASGRFTGTGSVFGETATVSGRVDASVNGSAPRILATLHLAPSNRVARLTGARRGS
ncbi:MAG: hypothetical protein QM770_07730 [Tepidisphaeraceae bacterium]